MADISVPMTQGTIWKRITFFALPLFLGNLFQQLYNTADSLIVGNLLGSHALAAVSSAGNLIFMLVGFLNGLSLGAGVVIARYYGAGDTPRMQTAIHTTAAMGLAASVLMTAAGVGLSPTILRWVDTPEAVMADSVTYLQLYFWGSLGVVMYNIFVGILQAIGDSKHPLYYLMISSVVNVVLDLVFVALFHWGVAGAAIATGISQLLSAGLCMARLLRTRESYRLSLRAIRFDWPMLRQIVRFGLPSGVQNSIIAFANLVVQANVNAFGEMAMAGVGAYSKIEGFGFLPITSFTMALTTFVSQNLGADDRQRAAKGARFGVAATVIMAAAVGVGVFILAPQLIATFDSTPEVIRFGVEKARTSALFFGLLAYSHAMAAILRGAGRAMVPMLVMMLFWCIARVAFLWVAVPLTQSIQAVYWVYPLTWFCSSATFFWCSRGGRWMREH